MVVFYWYRWPVGILRGCPVHPLTVIPWSAHLPYMAGKLDIQHPGISKSIERLLSRRRKKTVLNIQKILNSKKDHLKTKEVQHRVMKRRAHKKNSIYIYRTYKSLWWIMYVFLDIDGFFLRVAPEQYFQNIWWVNKYLTSRQDSQNYT